GRGWGDGVTSAVALRAAVALFKEPLSTSVQVQLLMDGHLEAQTTLDPQHTREVASLEAPVTGIAGEHRWTVKADPPVPGLGFNLTVTGYAPWKTGQSAGLELQ